MCRVLLLIRLCGQSFQTLQLLQGLVQSPFKPTGDPYGTPAGAGERGVSAEYLLNGSKENLAENTLSDKELLSQFKAVEQMSDDEKSVVKKVIDALITKSKLKQLAV